MANKFPLILNTSANQIQEIASGDNLDLTGCGINNAGVITATSFSGNGAGLIGVASTDYILTGTAATFTGGVDINSDLDVDGHTNLDNVSVAGVITATSFVGSGANLTGIDATSIKDPGGNVKVQAQASGAMHTGISTFGDIDVDGHTNLDNVSISGVTTFTGNIDANAQLDVDGPTHLDYVSISGVTTHSDTVHIIDDKVLMFGSGGDSTIEYDENGTDQLTIAGAVTRFTNTTQSTSKDSGSVILEGGLGIEKNLSVGGNVSIGGTLTYEDVTNIDSVGLITARNGINVSSGTATFAGAIDANGSLDVDGATALDALTVDDDATFNGATTNMLWDKSDSKLKFNNILNIYNKDGSSRIEGASGGMFFKATGAYVWSNNSSAVRLEALDASCILYANGGKVARSRPGEFQVGNPDAGVGVAVTMGITGNALFGGTGIVTATSFKLADGSDVGGVTSDAQYNTVGGTNSGDSFTGTDAIRNTLYGFDTGTAITTGDNNTLLGYNAGKAIIASSENVIVGSDAGSGANQSTASRNVIIGYQAIQNQDNPNDQVAIGYRAMANQKDDASGNVALGSYALECSTNQEVHFNTVIGMYAGQKAESGFGQNVLVGYSAGQYVNNCDYCTAVGYLAMRGTSSPKIQGNHNTAHGYRALTSLQGSNGALNTAVGSEAGDSITTGSNNICIGYQADATSATTTNEITLGNANITKFRIPGIGLELTGPVGVSTEQVTPSSNVATLNLVKNDHKIVASGTYTITCTGGTEADSHVLRIENSGTANVGFSTYFKFPSGGTPSLPTASGAISLISFTVHKTGAVGVATVLLSGASVNYS